MLDLTFYQWANVIKGYALAIGVAFAITMIMFWWQRSQRAQRANREAQAKRVYATYLLQAMQNPELARPAPADSSKGRQRAQYQWFVGYLLTICEEILLIDPTPAWRDAGPPTGAASRLADQPGVPRRTLSRPDRRGPPCYRRGGGAWQP